MTEFGEGPLSQASDEEIQAWVEANIGKYESGSKPTEPTPVNEAKPGGFLNGDKVKVESSDLIRPIKPTSRGRATSASAGSAGKYD